MPPPFTLVTGNLDKRREAERILGVSLVNEPLDLPEIQSLDLKEVLLEKAAEAWRRLQRPVVVEETGFELAAMNGFPGPLVKWMLDAVGPEGIAHNALALGNPKATARCMLLYRDGETSHFAEGFTDGVLVEKPRGEHGFGWDPVFRPEERQETFAELDPSEKDALGHRGRAWRAFAQVLRDVAILEPLS